MMKHSILMVAAAAATSMLAGCDLYFGSDHNDGSWNYCGQDGYYECNSDNCYWQGPTCPPGSDGMQPPGGYECNTSNDCAAGCYCTAGTCEEAGFCTQDSDCGNGYHCNTQRSSCEPNGTMQPTSCIADTDCATGSYCNPDTLKCEATCTCMSDADATAQGFAYCDTGRTTCLPGIDPGGDCVGTVTCNLGRPTCPEGSVATISEGCYTGSCQAINTCGTAPGCNAFTNESDCAAASSCELSYTGINCHNTMNPMISCSAGAANCVCDSYQFASCSDATP